jgi:hypothetical protein
MNMEKAKQLDDILEELKQTVGPRKLGDELKLREAIQAHNEQMITDLMVQRGMISVEAEQ